MRDGNLARRGAGDDNGGAALGEKTTQVVGVVALVADERARWQRCGSRRSALAPAVPSVEDRRVRPVLRR